MKIFFSMVQEESGVRIYQISSPKWLTEEIDFGRVATCCPMSG